MCASDLQASNAQTPAGAQTPGKRARESPGSAGLAELPPSRIMVFLHGSTDPAMAHPTKPHDCVPAPVLYKFLLSLVEAGHTVVYPCFRLDELHSSKGYVASLQQKLHIKDLEFKYRGVTRREL
eukprot:Hpha_TRINITY_DN28399_c0_g1::TRINITY_DN28399_c0_g1_i1::g.2259::m.2259